MESLSDDLVEQISRFVNDPADLARFALTCRRAYQLCHPLALVISDTTYCLRQQPIFLETTASDDDADVGRIVVTSRQYYQHRDHNTQKQSLWEHPLYLFVYHAPSNQRAYLGRFQRTQLTVPPSMEIDNSLHLQQQAQSEVHYGLAFKAGKPEEHWTISVVRGNHFHHGNGATSDVLVTLHCHGTERDCRGWVKARDLTSNDSGKGLQLDMLGNFFTPRSRQQPEEEEKGSVFRLSPFATTSTGDSWWKPLLQAPLIPVVPKPLLSFAGKVTVFEPCPFTLYDFWRHVPPPSATQIAIEFHVTLAQGIYTVHAHGMTFGVSIPLLREDALHTAADYHYFLLHLFRRNSGRWETLLTYFTHTARALLSQQEASSPHQPMGPQAAAMTWPTEHRDHSYRVRNNNLYIHVRDGVIDTRAPTILPSTDPWRLFLCDI